METFFVRKQLIAGALLFVCFELCTLVVKAIAR